MRSSKMRLLSALTWLVFASRAVISDPVANETMAMLQTAHVRPRMVHLKMFNESSPESDFGFNNC
jgi:hypothetical protein